nr:hypothetical protein Iba_chr10aCG10350 [Ipomoea batatas]
MSTRSSDLRRSTGKRTWKPAQIRPAAEIQPQRAAVTVASVPPLPESCSPKGRLRSFPVFRPPPAPRRRISLGSKKAGSARSADPSTRGLAPRPWFPPGLPLTATHTSDPDGGAWRDSGCEAREGEGEGVLRRGGRTGETHCRDGWPTLSPISLRPGAKTGNEYPVEKVTPLKKVHREGGPRIKELEGKLKQPRETGRQSWSVRNLGERILTDPSCFAAVTSARGRETRRSRSGLPSSRTPVGDDLMYEFGTWALSTCGRRAMRMNVKEPPFEVSMEETRPAKGFACSSRGEVPRSPVRLRSQLCPRREQSARPIVEVSAGHPAEGRSDYRPASGVVGRRLKRRATQQKG